MISKWVYMKTDVNLYTVGYYEYYNNNRKKWHSDSDHSTKEEAAKRVAWLNGGENVINALGEMVGKMIGDLERMNKRIESLRKEIEDLSQGAEMNTLRKRMRDL